MTTVNNNIEFYNQNADELFQQYQSLSFNQVHRAWLDKVDVSQCQTVLDIGAGSGRDAKALAQIGLRVTAIEPAEKMRQKGEQNTNGKARWLSATLPDLTALFECEAELGTQSFDLILISAVWMHLTQEQQIQSLSNLKLLLNNKGVLVITLRHGEFNDGRTKYELNSEKIIAQAESKGLKLLYKTTDADQLSRDKVYWETLIITPN